jgi:hypothetical protein
VFFECGILSAITVDSANPNYSSVGGVLFDKAQRRLMQYPSSKAGTSYIIPNSVTNIGDSAFNRCHNLTSVTIPNSVTSIGDEAFTQCQSLSNVTIPNSVTSIGVGAFSGCVSLTSVTIGSSLTNIGDSAFGDCWSLTAITVDSANPNYSSVGGVLFDKGQTTLMQYPYAKAGASYTIPNSVTNIADSAFSGCQSLTSLTIPNSVTSIGNYTFSECTSLTSITIPNGVNSIGDSAFYFCYSLTNVTIPASVTSIGHSAFSDCYGLHSVTIPNSVTSIGDGAFYDCDSLTTVFFRGNAPTVGVLAFVKDDSYGIFYEPPVTNYYLPGTTGWRKNYGGARTAIWTLPYPLVLSGSVGVQTNGFAFTVSWATNAFVVVEASTDLKNPSWSPVQTNALNNGVVNFTDPQWAKSPSRFCRVRSQ